MQQARGSVAVAPESTRSAGSFVIGSAQIAAPPLQPALYLVATPIGNLTDITIRALETLAAADVLACEDTRVTRVLLQRYGIAKRMTAYHEHNAAQATPRLLAALEAGQSVALVSDAGTPLVSDPGYRLVEAVLEKGMHVVPIPGPSAVLAALTVSGLPTDSFLFAGFLPAKEGQRKRRLQAIAEVPATLIFFEAPRRFATTLAAMAEVLGPRKAVVGRELTKAFEEVRRASLPELVEHYRKAGPPKGEAVVCVAPFAETKPADEQDTDRLLLALSTEMPASRAAGEAARMTGGRKSDLYRRLLDLKEAGNGD